MPRADQIANKDVLLREMLVGDGKTRKTTWALKWAELGYNVLFLDGDDGWQILRQGDAIISQAARERIWGIRLVTRDAYPSFSRFLAHFLKPKNDFFWDEDNFEAVSPIVSKNDHAHYYIDARKLTSNDIVLVDSWTALVESTFQQFALENELDLSDAKDPDDKFGGLRFMQNYLNWILMRMHALPCHVIVVAHSYTYEKWDRRDKRNPKLVKQRVLPISSSGPHSEKIIKHFSDVLNFFRIGSEVYIDSSGEDGRDGGSRIIPPQKKMWKEMDPAFVAKLAGIAPTPNSVFEAAKWIPPGTDLKVWEAERRKASGVLSVVPQAVPTVSSEKPTPPTIGSGGSLLGKLNLGNKGG